jgi:kinesin family protein 18/19
MNPLLSFRPAPPTPKAPSSAAVAAAANQALMTVAIRVRPLSSKEQMNGHRSVVSTLVEENVCNISKLERSGAVLQSEKGQRHGYQYDRVFDDTATNEDVYVHTVRDVLPKVLAGTNCTILAYGATGAGKTHTIMGYEGDAGMMPRSVIDLFAAIESSPGAEAYSVSVSYMEGTSVRFF